MSLYFGFRPQARAMPRHEPSTGAITQQSPGPSLSRPTRGFSAVWPWTSWSYWRMIHSLERTFGAASTRLSDSV